MKKIIAMFALMIMVVLLASCWWNKEGSKVEEWGEWAKVESAEKSISIEKQDSIKKDNNLNNITWSNTWIITWTGKTENQVVKDFENELDWLFKLLETNAK